MSLQGAELLFAKTNSGVLEQSGRLFLQNTFSPLDVLMMEVDNARVMDGPRESRPAQ